MSQTLAIACDQCKRYVDVGQSSNSAGWFVYGTETNIALVSKFADRHYGHPVRFIDVDQVDFDFEDEQDVDKAAKLDQDLPALLNQQIHFLHPWHDEWQVGKVRRIRHADGGEHWMVWCSDNNLVPMMDVEEWKPLP